MQSMSPGQYRTEGTSVLYFFVVSNSINRRVVGDIPRGFFSWISSVTSVKDTEQYQSIGPDAFVFIQTMNMFSQMFALMAIVSVIILLPVYVTGEEQIDPSNLLFYTSSNLSSGSARLWASWCMTWLFSFFAYYFLYLYYQLFTAMRQNYQKRLNRLQDGDTMFTGFQKRMLKAQVRTVLVRGIPPEIETEKQAIDFFNDLGIGQVDDVVFSKDYSRLRKLMDERRQVLRSLESAYAVLIKAICKRGPRSDQINSIQLSSQSEIMQETKHKQNSFMNMARSVEYHADLRPLCRKNKFIGSKVDAVSE